MRSGIRVLCNELAKPFSLARTLRGAETKFSSLRRSMLGVRCPMLAELPGRDDGRWRNKWL
jgi:hypothetical protein